MTSQALSIVIPAYNEGERLGPTLSHMMEYVVGAGLTAEIVVVDDGSTDNTAGIAESSGTNRVPVRVLRHEQNRGKGSAVRTGVLTADGAQILVCDADLATPIEDIERLQPWVEQGFDIAIGSRDMPDSSLDPPQGALRRSLGAAFRTLRRRLLLPKIQDTQCGFKLFQRRAARDVFEKLSIGGWLYDCEALALAEQLGYRIKEVGVHWRNHPDSRVRVVPTALAAVPTLLAIRRRVRTVGR